MALDYQNLDATTRQYMLAELRRDLDEGRFYESPWLTDAGRSQIAAVLERVVLQGDDGVLADVLAHPGVLAVFERNAKGDATRRRVPKAAARMLAELDFNRYYVRGVCRRAMDEKIARVEVYRAKSVREPRPASDAKIGQLLDPRELLEDLRENAQSLESRLGVPGGPGSGLSVRLPSGRGAAS